MQSIIDHNGVERFLGNNVPEYDDLKYSYVELDESELIPESQWGDLIALYPEGLDDPYLPPVHDQDGIGQCNADASVALIEYCRAKAGLPYVQLSAADLYHRINGGSDRGSLLEDALEELRLRGVGTAATCGTLWQGRGQKLATPEERKQFMVLEWTVAKSYAALMTLVFRGFSVNSGVMWYPNFTPDGDGWLPSRGSGSPGGHAVFGYKPVMRPGRGSGGMQYGIAHQNSWKETWGLKGRCVFPQEIYGGPVGGWFAARLVTTESQDTPAPSGV